MDIKAPDNKALNAKGTVKMDLPVGKPFEPTYVYQLLKLNKYDGAFKVRIRNVIPFKCCCESFDNSQKVGLIEDKTVFLLLPPKLPRQCCSTLCHLGSNEYSPLKETSSTSAEDNMS